MDVIREQLLYKQNNVFICMKNLNQKEQYECIRLLVASRTKDVHICAHQSTNQYINTLFEKLNIVTTTSCDSV